LPTIIFLKYSLEAKANGYCQTTIPRRLFTSSPSRLIRGAET
jgi:hypothetical protein